MYSAETIQKKLESLKYQDSPVFSLTIEYFTDETTIILDDTQPIILKFIESYYSSFDHYWGDYQQIKPKREWKLTQLPYFMEDIKVEIVNDYKLELYKFYIHMPPLKIIIVCKDLLINGISVNMK